MIKIKDAEIYKNSRILLGEDCHIRYHPESNYQVILGQNGIGKSTLLENLLSYPSLGGKAFHKDGFSRVVFDANGKDVLVRMGEDGKYIFEMDNTNLNEGGTQSVQKDLYMDVFGISPAIEEILSPRFDFCAMRPQKRQEFLASLTTGDLSFAMAMFKKLEQRTRQHEGTVKRLESSLVALQSKIIPDEEYADYKAKLEDLSQSIKEIYLEIQDNGETVPADFFDNFDRRLDALVDDLKVGWVKRYPFGGVNAKDDEDAQNILSGLASALASVNAEYESVVKQFNNLAAVKERISSGPGSLDEIIKRRDFLREELAKVQSADDLAPIVYDNPRSYENARYALEEVMPTLVTEIGQLDDMAGKELVQVDLEALRVECAAIIRKAYLSEAEVESIDKELAHVHTGEVRCPECNKLFTPGLDAARRNKMEKRRQELLDSATQLRALYDQKCTYGKEVADYQKRYASIKALFNSRELRPVLDWINTRTELSSGSFNFMADVNFALHSLRQLAQRTHLESDLAELAEQESFIRSNGSTEWIESSLEDLEKEIFELNNRKLTLSKKHFIFKTNLEKVRQFRKWADEKIDQHASMGRELFAAAEISLNEIRKEIVQELQASANALSRSIADYEKDKAQLDYLKELIEKEKLLAIASKKSADELSPKSGVIAEQLIGFIEAFFSDVMEVINSIWTYNVQIYPAKDNSNSLSYLFPIEFNDSSTPSPDIAKTSTGQYSIVNFAVKIVALRYKGYHGSPLFLDEPEADIHPVHKVKMMNFVRDLVEIGAFSQVFIISHHEAAWGALPYPDVVDFSYESAGPNVNKVITFK